MLTSQIDCRPASQRLQCPPTSSCWHSFKQHVTSLFGTAETSQHLIQPLRLTRAAGLSQSIQYLGYGLGLSNRASIPGRGNRPLSTPVAHTAPPPTRCMCKCSHTFTIPPLHKPFWHAHKQLHFHKAQDEVMGRTQRDTRFLLKVSILINLITLFLTSCSNLALL